MGAPSGEEPTQPEKQPETPAPVAPAEPVAAAQPPTPSAPAEPAAVAPASVAHTTAAATPARRPSRTWILVLLVIVALLIAVPVTVYKTIGIPWHRNPAAGGAASASPTAGSAGPSSAHPSPTASGPGAILVAELMNATLTIPGWLPATGPQCPTSGQKFAAGATAGGTVEFNGGKYGPFQTSIKKVVYSDVDYDGTAEAVALLVCEEPYAPTGQVYEKARQVAVFDRDAAGRIVTVGQVIGYTGDVANIFDIAAGPGGSVEVEVGDLRAPDDLDKAQAWPLRQWRTYALFGTSFRQTVGSTSFAPNPHSADLHVTAGELVLGAANSGVQRGTLTVTVGNNGPLPVAHTQVRFTLPNALILDGPVWSGCDRTSFPGSTGFVVTCAVDGLAPGTSRSYTFGFATSAAPTSGTVSVLTPDHNDPTNPVFDLRPDNDNRTFAIRTA